MYGGYNPQYNPHGGGPRRPSPLQPPPSPLQPPQNYYSPPQNYYSPPQPNPYYHQNPNLYFPPQNPTPSTFSTPPRSIRPPQNHFPTPQSSSPSPQTEVSLQRIEQAAVKSHRDLLASGETISAWKISHSVLLSLKSDSWSSLGFQIQQIPSLYRLMLVEGKVNCFIHCFVGVRRITTLRDLDIEICKSEGVQRFDELELGPLLKHPLVIHYFTIPSDTKEIVDVTSEDVIRYLGEFMDKVKNRTVKTEEFMDFVATKRSVRVKETLGVRIQNLRMHVNAIRDARKMEDSTLNKYIQSVKKEPKEGIMEGNMAEPRSITLQKKGMKKRYFSISQRLKSFSPLKENSKHIRFVSSSSDDEDNLEDEITKDDSVSGSHEKSVSDQRVGTCPYPSANEEKKRLGLRIEMDGQSAEKPIVFSGKKRKIDHTGDYTLKLPKKDKEELSGHKLELLQDSGGKSKGSQRQSAIADVDKAGDIRLTDNAMEQFVTTWKEACRLHSIPEVLDKMLQFYNSTERRRKNMRSMFKSFPCIGILHVAVTSIKYGMCDSLYDAFEAIGEPEPSTSTPGPVEPECISIEPSTERDALRIKQQQSSQLDCGTSVDDICKEVSTFFELNHPILVEGKSVLDRQFMFLKKLYECQIWVAKQFSVKEFGSLGYGDFYRFLEEHPHLIPKELLESLFKDASKNSTSEVSLLRRYLIVLLSQAASYLWENEAITKEHIHQLLKKQFPLISFDVSGDSSMAEFRELSRKPKSADNYSILFSVTLLETDSVSLVQNDLRLLKTGVKTDIGLISGALGSVSSKDAIECLLKAPMLSDLQSWTHWELIYAPSLGPLVQWLLNEVYTKELLCLVTKDGKVVRIDHSATADEFLEALIKASPHEAAVKLLSLFSLYGGERHVPLALLRCHAQRGIGIILKNTIDSIVGENNLDICMGTSGTLKRRHGLDGATMAKQPFFDLLGKNAAFLDVKDQHRINRALFVASKFILDCLCYLPSEFHKFASGVFLSGLQFFIKEAPMAILHECSQPHQRRMLHEVGLSLNISEWIADYREFTSNPNDLSISSGISSALVSHPTACSDSKLEHGTSKGVRSSNDNMAIEVEPDVRNEGLGEIHGNKVDKVPADRGSGGSKHIQDVDENQDGSLIIESIRREEFGLVANLTDADDIMLKKQHARLGRALQCLSQELYSQDSHFLLELVQNADDNSYPEHVEPTLVFILQSSGIVVLNNEQGFTAKNIRALCDVGNSTKKGSNAGYIGQKGIGFKSVFRVTDAPQIHSNGFHVKFDISEGQIGFVLPTEVSPCDIGSLRRLLPDEASRTDMFWNTCIVLPFKPKLRDEMGLSPIVSLFSDLHPSLLLFLHRLKCIKFKNMLNDTFTVMKREHLEDGIVKVSHGNETMSWLLASQTLGANVVRPDVQSTKIAVAFTLKQSSDGEYIPHLEQQPVFAFLPLRTYGLKFILQGDFVLPSSREEVDADNAWNQWLLGEFPSLFVSAQKSFVDLRCFRKRPGRAVAAYMCFVPLVGEVHGFFSQLPRMIISKLRISNCLLLEGKDEWVPPCRVLSGWDEQARILLPDNLLYQYLGLGYLDKDIVLSDSLAKALGVNVYEPKVLIEMISSICHGDAGIKSLGMDWLCAWFSTLYMMLVHSPGQASVNAWVEADLTEMLRKVPIIPLSDGSYGSVAEGTIWITCDADNCESESELFATLYAKLRIVSPTFLSAAAINSYGWDGITVDNIIKMLLKVGVQKLAAHELIRVHILPALSDIKSVETDKKLMTEYLSFVMLHLQSSCPNCHTERETIISELKRNAFILTNHGYKKAAEEPIHFSRDFGNPIDMTRLIDISCYDWHEVDSVYLKHLNNKSSSFGLMNWREFLQELGVTDFVQTVEIEKNVADVSHALLNDIMCDGKTIVSGLVVKDWESPELVNLLATLSSLKNREKSIYLLEVLDRMWDDCLHSKVTGCCIYGSQEDNKQFKSSFVRSINNVQWVVSRRDHNLHFPKDLFYDCEEVRSILGSFAPYAVPQVTSRNILTDIGLKTQVNIDDALRIFEVLRSFNTPFTASVAQMSKLYAFIRDEMGTAKADTTEKFSSGPFIFVPVTTYKRQDDVVSGRLFSSEDVYWHDPTGAIDLMKQLLLRSGSLTETNKMLSHVYQGLHDFFVDECKVSEQPSSRSYIHILMQLSKVALPSQAAKTVLRVVLKWANDFEAGLLGLEDVVYLKESLLKPETTVLPTVQDKWVSLHSYFGLVCWSNNDELWKQFKHSDNINFLYFGELSSGDKEVLPAKISSLMQALGVPSLSEIITREAIFYGTVESREKALLVNWVLPYAQRYISKLHPDKYACLKHSGFETICNLKVVVVEKLFYKHAVKGCDNASNKRIECSSLLQENSLYVSKDSNSHAIFMELSRLFFNGFPELHLSNFLHLITTMAESGSTEEQTETFVVDSQKIPKLPENETIWFLSSFFSQQMEDVVCNNDNNILPIIEEQQFKRKPGNNTNWPPADWKTAPDFTAARHRKKYPHSQPPSHPHSQASPYPHSQPFPHPHSRQPLEIDISGDWVIEESASNIDFAPEELSGKEQKPLYMSNGLHFGSSSKKDHEEEIFNERDQISYGTPNEYQAAITGKTGELAAYNYFAKKVRGVSVKWVNEVTETGLPYDIVIGDNEENKEYVEVKATVSGRKDWFTISNREWRFAEEKGELYSIAHVFLVGPNNAKVKIFKDPVRLCQQGLLRLVVLMPKGQEDLVNFVT
ncbi:hypothetical protein ACHQM5_028128 [Ranunculus cassubicifolius]